MFCNSLHSGYHPSSRCGDQYVKKASLTVQFLVSEVPDLRLEQAIDAGLEAHGKDFVAEGEPLKPLQVSCRDNEGKLVGGLVGNTGNSWFHIWQLWVSVDYRNRSFGSQILETAEGEAIYRGCTRAHVETLSFQAVKFYLDRGYEEFGVLPAYVGTHSQHYLKKTLVI